VTDSRVLTEYVEAASTGTPASRVGTEYVEAASTGSPARRVGTEYVEAASTGTPARRLATGYLEVLTPTAAQALTVQFKHRESGAWVERTAAPKVRVAGAWVTLRPQYWDGAAWIDLT
jgi:hypothetical protein